MNDWDFSTEDASLAPPAPPVTGSEWVQRLVNRLGNVRIHDTAQAGELASRLGARAFTIGRDVYVRPDLMRPANSRSMSLLAHELFHVGEQTGVSHAALEMPLLQPSQPTGMSGRGTSARGVAVQRAPAGDTTVPASLSGSEIAAEAIESAVVRQNVAETSGQQRAGQEPPDPNDIADKVYNLIARDLMLDRERAAYGW